MPMPKRLIIALLAAAALAAPRAGRASDGVPPFASGIDATDCEGVFQFSGTTSTGTPNIELRVQDSNSGLRIGRAEHVGGNSVRPNTVLLMHFDAALGVLTDSAAVSNTASLSGVPPVSAAGQGGFAEALQWDGVSNQYVKINSSGTLNSTTAQLTIQAWIDPADTTSRPIFEFNNGANFGVRLWQGVPGQAGNGELYANLRDTTSFDHPFNSAAGTIQANQWQLVTLTFDGSTARLFVSSSQVASAAITVVSTGLLTSYDAYVGNSPSAAKLFKGLIDEVRVLNRPITTTDVIGDFYSGIFEFSTSSVNGPYTAIYLGGQSYAAPANSTGTQLPAAISANSIPFQPGNQNFVRYTVQDMAGNTTVTSANFNVQTGVPNAPSGLQGSPLGPSSIQWSWSQANRICMGTYSLYNSTSGPPPFAVGIASAPPPPNYTEAGFSTNTLHVRQVGGVSAFGSGVLSAGATSYTAAVAPLNLQSTFSLTGTTLGVSWNGNGNPLYTRWELSYATDPAFSANLSTPIKITDNYTSTAAVLTGLSPSTTYYVRVRAQNGSGTDNFSFTSTFTAFALGAFPTLASPPPLSAAAAGTSSITWTWGLSGTATGYTLISSTGGILVDASASVSSFTETGLSTNTFLSAQLKVNNLSGSGPLSGLVGAFTLAAPPIQTSVLGVATNAATVAWNTNGNPNATIYQLALATSSSFALFVTTQSTTSSTFTFTGLLPETTYFMHVRALNGDSIPSAFDAAVSALTPSELPVTSTPTPPSPYVLGANVVGAWHFDEISGTRTADASGNGNDGMLTCFSLACTTPTFSASFSGMGNAVSYFGVRDTLCRVPDSPSLETSGSVTVEAWVNPSQPAQISGAGLVAKGGGSDANLYALDISGNQWRFLINDSLGTQRAVLSTQTIVAGRWTHVIGVYDQSGPSLSIYVNGVLSNSSVLPGGTTRLSGTHELSIGSRQSAAGSYDLAFAGLIDEVHVSSRVLSAAEAAADYRSALPTQMSMPFPNQNVTLVFLPNTFPAGGSILVSSDPLHYPIHIDPRILADGLASLPTGYTLVPNSVVEVVISIGGMPFTGSLGSSATISLPYPDLDNNNLVDGTVPPLPADKLLVFTLDPTVVRWLPLPSSVDTTAKRVLGMTPHFSVFALFGPSGIKPDLSTVRVYPVPWLPHSGGRFDSASFGGKTGLVFDNLPLSGVIRIFTLSAELVAEVPFNSANVGTAVWDGKNRSGRDAASGVYFAYIKPGDGSATTIKKFAIER